MAFNYLLNNFAANSYISFATALAPAIRAESAKARIDIELKTKSGSVISAHITSKKVATNVITNDIRCLFIVSFVIIVI